GRKLSVPRADRLKCPCAHLSEARCGTVTCGVHHGHPVEQCPACRTLAEGRGARSPIGMEEACSCGSVHRHPRNGQVEGRVARVQVSPVDDCVQFSHVRTLSTQQVEWV